MKRIAILQIWQESNSFNPVLTNIGDFQMFGLNPGEQNSLEIAGRFGEEIAGFLKGLKAWPESADPIVLLMAQAWPGGPLSVEAKNWFFDTVTDRLKKFGPFDGLLLSLHGALTTQDEFDFDGLLLEKIRNTLMDRDIPIVATIDLHAYLTPKMIHNSDCLVAYHTNPHIDRLETGQRASRVLSRILHCEKPVVQAIQLPMIASGEVTQTSGYALGPVFEKMRQLENDPRILSAAVLLTQPYLDVPQLGWSTMIAANADKEYANRLAVELAEMCWQKRGILEQGLQFYSAVDCVRNALKTEGKPVIIADGADATNSGAPGDSTHLLKAFLEQDIPGGALTIMVDPHAVAHAAKVGEGGQFNFAVGGKRDNIFSKPLHITGQVLFIRPARYTLRGHLAENLPIDMGSAAAVRTRDITLLLVERPGPGSTPMMYRCVGLEPRAFKIVTVKSPAGFRADFASFAAAIFLSACPGCANPYLEQMPYKNITRPLWPLDKIEDWNNISWCARF